MPESWQTRFARWAFNWFPAYRGTGARVTYIAADWREVRIRLPLNWRTRNYVGSIFGGSLYGAVDPICMMMPIKLLGPGYIVWDKAATIRFLRPGREGGAGVHGGAAEYGGGAARELPEAPERPEAATHAPKGRSLGCARRWLSARLFSLDARPLP
jgi:acyl-coenzyme A thioesterase PaaI-like protein